MLEECCRDVEKSRCFGVKEVEGRLLVVVMGCLRGRAVGGRVMIWMVRLVQVGRSIVPTSLCDERTWEFIENRSGKVLWCYLTWGPLPWWQAPAGLIQPFGIKIVI